MSRSFFRVVMATALAAATALPALAPEAIAGPIPAMSPPQIGLQGATEKVWYRGGYRGGYYRRGYGGYYRGGYSYNPGAAIAAGAVLGIAGAAAAAAASQNNYYYSNPGYYAYPGYGYPGYSGW